MTENRRLSQPIFLAPRKRIWETCIHSKACGRECVNPKLPEFNDLIKEKLKREMKHWIGLIRGSRGADPDTRNRYVDELSRVLEGSVIPSDLKIGNGEYCACGASVPVLGIRLMQAFTIEELKEASQGMSLQVPLIGAYEAISGTSISGLSYHYAVLLSRIAMHTAQEDSWALRALEVEGGLRGIRSLSMLAAEPAVPFETRMAFLDSLSRMSDCTYFDGEKPQAMDMGISLSVSRFSMMERVAGEFEGVVVSISKSGKEAPEARINPDFSAIRQFCICAKKELLQAVFNIAGRIDAVLSHRGCEVKGERELLAGYYLNLRSAILALAGKRAPNAEIAGEALSRKGREMSGGEPEAYLGEQVLLRTVVQNMLRRGELDEARATQMTDLLSKKEAALEKRVERLEKFAHELASRKCAAKELRFDGVFSE